jgi:hypothetical protein
MRLKSWKVGVFPIEIRWFPLKFNCGIPGQSKSKQSPIGAEVCVVKKLKGKDWLNDKE